MTGASDATGPGEPGHDGDSPDDLDRDRNPSDRLYNYVESVSGVTMPPPGKRLTRSIALVGHDGTLTHVMPYDDCDRRHQLYVGIELGSTAATKADRKALMRAYGEAQATGRRTSCRYHSTAAGGRVFQFHFYRFPPAEAAGIVLSAELPPGESSLTTREIEVLRLAAEDATDSEIAAELKIARPTVSRHKQNIRAKLGVREWAAAVIRAERAGLL